VTDGRTDGQFSSLDRVCIACSAVKTFKKDFNIVIKTQKLTLIKTFVNAELKMLQYTSLNASHNAVQERF